MQFQLILTDAEREFLIGAVERAVIDDAASTHALASRSILWPKKNAEAFERTRASLHTGAGLLGKLSPDALQVLDDVAPTREAPVGPYADADARALAEAIPDFDRRALDPRCAHGLPFTSPCDLCQGNNGSDVRTMPIQT